MLGALDGEEVFSKSIFDLFCNVSAKGKNVNAPLVEHMSIIHGTSITYFSMALVLSPPKALKCSVP